MASVTALPLSPFIFDPEHRFVLNEGAFMDALGYVPPAARPENFAKYMAVLDDEIARINGVEPADVPAFLGDPSPAFLAAEIEPLLKTLFHKEITHG